MKPKGHGEILPIPGFRGYYAAEDGTLWSRLTQIGRKGRKSPRLIGDEWKKLKTPRGPRYQVAGLFRDGKPKSFGVHQVILLTFEGPCPDGLQARHLNGDETDNRRVNLKWGTPKENGEDRVRHGTALRGRENGFSKLDETQVCKIKRRIARGDSYKKIAADFQVCLGTIGHIATGRNWGWL